MTINSRSFSKSLSATLTILFVLSLLITGKANAIAIDQYAQLDPVEQCGVSLFRLLQGQFVEAQPQLQEAVELLKASPTANPTTVGMCALYLAIVHHSTGDWIEALDAYNTALTSFIDTDEQQMQWAALFGKSGVYGARGNFDEAYKTLQLALPLTGAVIPGSAEARCLRFDEAADLPANVGDQPWVVESLKPLARAVTLNNIGLALAVPISQEQPIGGSIDQVQICYEKTLELISSLRQPGGDTTDLTDQLAEVLGPLLGIDESTLRMMLMFSGPSFTEEESALLAQLLPVLQVILPMLTEDSGQDQGSELILGLIAVTIPDLAGALEPIALSNLGQTLRGTDDEQAQVYLEEALQQLEANQAGTDLNDVTGLLSSFEPLLALSGLDSGSDITELTDNVTEMLDSMALLRNIINLNARAIILNNLALVYRDQGDVARAERTFQEVLDIYQKQLANNANTVNVLVNLGYLAQTNGDVADALGYYDEAIGLLESVRTVGEGDVIEFGNEMPQTIQFVSMKGVLDQQADVYALAANLYLQQGETTEALRVVEQGRSRLFLDMVSSRALPLQGEEGRLLTEIRAAFDQQTQAFSSLAQLRAMDAPFTQIQEWERQWQTANERYDALRAEITQTYPQLLDLIPGKVDRIDLSALQERVLDDETTVIVYYLADGYFADETDNLAMAWVIDNGEVHAVPLATEGETVRAQVKSLRDSIIEEKDIYTQAAVMLYDTLMAPLESYIQHSNLVIVPYGSLYYLPFAALWNAETERYLVEDYTLTYAPSLATLPLIQAQRNPNGGDALVMGIPDGFPPLPAVRGEVEAIGAILATEPLLSQAATESTLYANASAVDIVHLAAHGNFDSVAPLQSAIELTGDDENDGILEVREVFGLDLAEANLVFLSACETALGDQSMGDEITGLTRAFLYAGTPSIVTTLWSIEDEASGALVGSFYEALTSEPSFAAALRAAQLATMQTPGWEDPYYWAAFTLHGDYLGSGERSEVVSEPPIPTATPIIIHATGVTTPTVPTPTPEPAVQLEIIENLNVRSGPGTAYERIGQLTVGNRVTVIGGNIDETWWEICCVDGQQGWVINNVNYMRVVESVD